MTEASELPRAGHNGLVHRDAWPLVGRGELVETVIGHLADPACDGVFLVGAPGVGATRVLSEVHDRLVADRPQSVSRLVGSQATQGTRFGALSHLIPGELGTSTLPLDAMALYQRIRDMIGTPSTPAARFVACVDDIRWLDEGTLGLLTQVLSGQLATLVATVRDDAALPEALDTIERSYRIRRVPVPPLSRDDTIDLVYAVMDSAVEGTTLHRLADACQGNPLFLAEIIDGSTATGALAPAMGTWTLEGAPTVTARVARLIDARLEAVGAAGRDLMELLALAEPVVLDALEGAGLLHVAIGLEEAGFLATGHEAPFSVGVAQPLVAAQLRARISPLRRRALLPRAIDLVTAGVPGRGDADAVRLALWRLECGQPITVAELERAAALARTDNDFESTAELTAAAVQIEPSFNALLLQAEALHDLCHFEEADAVMHRAEQLVTDDLTLLRLAVVRHRGALWGRHDGDGSVRVLQEAIDALSLPVLRDLARSAMANALVFSGHPADVDGVLAGFEGDGPLENASQYFSRTIAATLAGHTVTAIELGREGLVRRAELPDQAPIGHPLLSSLALGVALVEHGSFAEAEAVLGAAYTAAVEQRNPQLQVWLGLTRGRGNLFAGDIDEARLWFLEARSVSDRIRFTQGARVALAGLAATAAQLGDRDTARRAAAALLDMPDDHGLHWPERRLGRAWGAVADDRLANAISELRAGVDEARARGEVLLQIELLYEMARLGAAAEIAAEFADVASGADGPLIGARRVFIEGMARADLRALSNAEKQFANLGAWLGAAESAAELGRVLQRLGRPRDAQGAAHRASQYISDVALVRTPLLVASPTPIDLSPRELEVALLAADGHPSKVIAQRLGLSVRTVSNHLQNAYLKLGISGRDDLGDALVRTGSFILPSTPGGRMN